MSINKYLNFTNSRFLKSLIRYPITGIFIHWTFQSMLNMDLTEKLYKLTLDVLLTIFFQFPLGLAIPSPFNWISALLVAHTINFFFNSHFWTLLKHYGLISNSKERFTNYSKMLFERISTHPEIVYAAVIGSVVRGEWSPHSDLDILIVRGPGIVKGLQACTFVLSERTRALLNRFPLDIYVRDSFTRLLDMRADENPEVIIDRRG